eukprot:1976492-Alexandrium_andersonii.AAC.1
MSSGHLSAEHVANPLGPLAPEPLAEGARVGRARGRLGDIGEPVAELKAPAHEERVVAGATGAQP